MPDATHEAVRDLVRARLDALRDAILRLRHVELRAVLVVKIGHVLVGDGNFRHDFAVEKFFNRDLTADFTF